MARYDVNNIAVSSLLSSIKDGSIAIPEIQRPFVWDSTKVRDLIDSLYQNYPVGYIIVWQNPDVKLKDGTISSGKKVLIDGQQRITALAAAIVGQEVVGADYRKFPIKIAFNPQEERFDVVNPAILKDVKYIPDIAAIFDPGFNSFGFVIDYCQKNGITDSEGMSKISDIITRLKSIENNNLGVINLSHELDIEQVTDIFIRINSKGVVLSQADFAMSKISSNEEYGGNIIRKMIDFFAISYRSRRITARSKPMMPHLHRHRNSTKSNGSSTRTKISMNRITAMFSVLLSPTSSAVDGFPTWSVCCPDVTLKPEISKLR